MMKLDFIAYSGFGANGCASCLRAFDSSLIGCSTNSYLSSFAKAVDVHYWQFLPDSSSCHMDKSVDLSS